MVTWAMNLLMYCTLSKNPWISVYVLGFFIYTSALIFLVATLIPF